MSIDEVRRSKIDELKIVRQPLARRDQAEKIAGTTKFAGDVVYPGTLHAGLVRSLVPSARIVRRDALKALAVPGVVDVLFGEDVPHNSIWVDVPGQLTEVAALKANMQVLATDRVRFQGEPMVLVLAETEEALAEACSLVEVDYEDMPGVFDPEEALEEGAPFGMAHQQWRRLGCLRGRGRDRGGSL
jgi:CO/xanthine dehydrogenase Mo-binding subunit